MSKDSISQITAKEFATLYQQGALQDALLLDVREPHEWEQQHLEQFTLIPMQQIPERIDELDHEKKIYVMCAHGVRSANVTEYLQKHGFQRAISIEGGIFLVSERLVEQ